MTYTVAALKELDESLTSSKNELNKKSEIETKLQNKVKNLEKKLGEEKTKVKTLQFQMQDVLNRLQELEADKS